MVVYQAGYNVLYVSLEMAEELIWERFAVNVSDVPMSTIRGSDPDVIQDLIHNSKIENGEHAGNIIIKKLPTTTTVVELDSLIQEILRSKGIKIDLLVLDYIGIMKPAKTSSSFKDQNLYTAGKDVAEQLRDLGNVHELAVLSASQFGREGYENNQASMKHTAGSAGLNDTADLMVTINRDPYLKEHSLFLHNILKNRYGPNSLSFISSVDYSHMRVRVADSEKIKEFNDHMVSNQMTIDGFNDAERELKNDSVTPKDFSGTIKESNKKSRKSPRASKNKVSDNMDTSNEDVKLDESNVSSNKDSSNEEPSIF